MAEVRIMVGGRQYAVHCRDGEEARLHELAALMSERVQQVSSGSPGLTEVRQLLFAGLLLADSLTDKAPAPAAAPPPPAEPEDESATLEALDALAQRIEALGDSLAAQLSNA
ncbi:MULTISPECIES: cell division protein ZapA [Sphingobium]|uniref:cell division protein ZapA n=1 Tax=Sphingobium TaxID=165695 RepID=UPI0015EC73AE|nr:MULTISPECIES: cell division protein ZapA [Sphingobium]MCW2362344.1 cell division protein ZapA [Sphingobium sp. B10D3B]MCW2400977.1 cell division protein ZapA [Sphingobium sp. B10D7B]MCW2407956.1 cell division protein ZapA [Sphingobium xanthum]MCW2411592.1 cell division protein ZapA [Sphingobium sp. B8D3D]MCW2416115.1 cell division protein ZapA [Sphingobium sp. B8D3A]